MHTFIALFFATLFLGASCKTFPEDRGSRPALEAGQQTMVLGACSSSLQLGHEYCPLVRGGSMPTLYLAFNNPADYIVGDCNLNVLKSGHIDQAGLVEVDTSRLQAQIEKNGFCILKVEAIERYPDPRDSKQLHEIPLGGILFAELLAQGYNISPPLDEIAFCTKIKRTIKGRTTIENCQ